MEQIEGFREELYFTLMIWEGNKGCKMRECGACNNVVESVCHAELFGPYWVLRGILSNEIRLWVLGDGNKVNIYPKLHSDRYIVSK